MLIFYNKLSKVLVLIIVGSNSNCSSLNDTHAIILARAGSKGIKNKNLLVFNGMTILGRTIETIKKTGLFQTIWVSTDSDHIEKEALKYDALVYRRLSAFAQDQSSSLDAVKEFLYKHNFISKFALFQCTSVFLKENYIIDAFKKSKWYSCVFAVTQSHKLRWARLGHNLILPLNFNPNQRPRRQDWEGELDETGMFYFSNKELVGKNRLQNYRCGVVEIEPEDTIEIDNFNDLKIAKCILEAGQNSLNSY